MISFEVKAIISDEDDPHGEHTVYLFNKEQSLLLPVKVNEESINDLIMAKEGREEPRPHIHNTTSRLITILDGKIDKIILSGYENEILYSYIRIKKGASTFDIDAKPSDALSIALRTGAPIQVHPEVIKRKGIKITQEMLEAS